MFRILIADDEGLMLQSIKSYILSSFESDTEIMCVKTGRAVIEAAESFRPDIAFVDIQMPGLSGIQAIQEIRKFNTSIVFIIISAYDNFSYAQEAVNLGVMEYITKPVNKKRILDVCVRAMRKVDESRQKLSDDLKIREKLEFVVPMIESGFIYQILQDDSEISKQNYLDMLDIRDPYGYILILEFGEAQENRRMTNAVGANVRANKHYNEIKELTKDYFECITGPIMGNRLVLFVPYKKDKMDYEERVETITRCRNMIRKLEERVDIRFRGGIGTVKTVDEICASYKEAWKALRESDSHIIHFMDIPTVSEYDGEYPLDLELKYLQRGAKADEEGAISCANEFFDWMEKESAERRSNIELKILELIMRLEKDAFDAGDVKYGFRYRENYLPEIQGAKNNQELRTWFLNKTREICSKIATSRQKESENIISRAKSYINDHYAGDVSLDEVSRLVDISPYYFSKLFRQEVGETFIEYLTRTRIRNARKLLDDPKYSIKEVCIECGYSDPNYFSRIFKKYEGMTPSEYRER